MKREHWQQAKEIFSAALDLPESDREIFITASCGADAELRHRVEQLIADNREAERAGFLQTTAQTTTPAFERVASGPALKCGDKLDNRYRIDALIGRGGMGEVYRAMDLELGVPIALKTIRPDIASDPASLRQFKQEVLLARSVSHPNVCRIYDLGRDETKGVAFLTMEYLPGETLASRIKANGAMEPATALPLIRQIAEALDAAHRAGIIHRDFKSANVMLVPAPDGARAVITDFGLAVAADVEDEPPSPDRSRSARMDPSRPRRPQDHHLMGTPAYMSPEQVQGHRAGPASDLYAFGVTLYEMSTGRLPFRNPDPVKTALAQLEEDPPLPSTFAPVEPDWERVILRLLSKQPGARHPSARDVVLALEGHDTGEPGSRYQLPAERDTFVGRTAELAVLAARLEGGRQRTDSSTSSGGLLTLVGLGGIGKTRLALRYSWESLPRWPGGVWFCDLSEARNVEGITLAVATALNVPLGRTDPIVQLGHAMAGRGRSLIILDNFEQVAEHAQATLGKWLEKATKTSFLVTSRHRLNLAHESTYDLEPLDPATHGVELFEVRAQGHRPGFVMDESGQELVRQIVTLLDGLPLAIELAASRLRMLSLSQLRNRLDDRFRTLARVERGRHATLRATMDWSWDLLSPWERSALAQASVFEGGFTVEAAEAVIELSSWPEAPPILDVLESLVNRSWLRMRPVLQAPRFGMYGTVQQYASERLRAEVMGGGSSGQREGAERRHGAYYAAMGTDEAIAALGQHGGVPKRAALHLEIDNLVAACRRAVERADAETAVATLAASFEGLSVTGPVSASIDLGQIVTRIPGIQLPERARAMFVVGGAMRSAGRAEEARRHFEEALAAQRDLQNRREEGSVLSNVGILHQELGRMEEARRLHDEALAIHREVGNRMGEGIVLGNLGTLHFHHGRMDDATRDCEEALAIHRDVGNRMGVGSVLGNLGMVHQNQGRMEEARRHYEDAVAIHREVGNRRGEAITRGNLGTLHQEQGRMEEARRHYEGALAIHRDVGYRVYEGTVLGNLGVLCLDQGRLEEARRHYEEALAVHRDIGSRRDEGVVLGNLGKLDQEQGRTEEARRHYEEALVIHRATGNRKFEGIVLGNLGHLHFKQGRIVEGRRHFEAGMSLLREVDGRFELSNLLCMRGLCEHEDANLPAAQSALAEAEAIAASLAVTPDSDLAREIDKLRSALEKGLDSRS